MKSYGFYSTLPKRPDTSVDDSEFVVTILPKRGRGRPRDDGTTTAMYIDYCTGMTLPEVAEKWGRGEQAIYRRFRGMKLPMRRCKKVEPRQPGNPPTNQDDLVMANQERSRQANKSRVPEAARLLKSVTNESQRRALMARIEFPYATLTELGTLMYPPVSKDTVAGLLRRARTKGVGA